MLQPILGSQISLINVAHGCLEHTFQIFRGGQSLRFHVVFCNQCGTSTPPAKRRTNLTY
jgi:hypothetical protein